jgi:hypothetical protein
MGGKLPREDSQDERVIDRKNALEEYQEQDQQKIMRRDHDGS